MRKVVFTLGSLGSYVLNSCKIRDYLEKERLVQKNPLVVLSLLEIDAESNPTGLVVSESLLDKTEFFSLRSTLPMLIVLFEMLNTANEKNLCDFAQNCNKDDESLIKIIELSEGGNCLFPKSKEANGAL